MDSLREEFPGSSYNIITRNCNTFSNELARLLLDKPVPGYINRLANMGSFMSCLLPRSLTGAAPVESEGAAAGGRAGAGGGASARRCVLACLRTMHSKLLLKEGRPDRSSPRFVYKHTMTARGWGQPRSLSLTQCVGGNLVASHKGGGGGLAWFG